MAKKTKKERMNEYSREILYKLKNKVKTFKNSILMDEIENLKKRIDTYDLDELYKAWYMAFDIKVIREYIELLLVRHIESNERYSCEYLYSLGDLDLKTVNIVFIPTTESFNHYGGFINVQLLFELDEIMELTKNKRRVINTYGNLRATYLTNDDVTKDLKERLATIGLHTNHILLAF